ncbi:MAG: hypothetical protein Ct9H90mP9_5920 [Pseudomonadota bacterium]|nr:MAG: hypothetical protein Ct9H90mP9_5920 [Pseudomonadota bacterium]
MPGKTWLNQPKIVQFFDFLIGIVTLTLGIDVDRKTHLLRNGPSVRTFPADCKHGNDYLSLFIAIPLGNPFRDQTGYLD